MSEETVETPQGSPAPEVSAPVVSDGWSGAEEAFMNPEEEVEAPEPTSHVEQSPEKKLFNLEKLAISHKYKPKVEEFFKPLIEEHEQKVQVANEQVEQFRQSVTGMVDIFKEIAQNPDRLPDYIAKYGEQLGIDPSSFRRPQEQQQPQQQEQFVPVDKIIDKYTDQLINEQDPRNFVNVQKAMVVEALGAQKQELMGVIGNILRTYHEQFVAPDKKTIEEYKKDSQTRAQTETFNSTKNSWNTALSTVKSKHEDFSKYEPQISKLLKEDPDFNELRQTLNKTPQEVARREKLIERIYKEVSENDRIAKMTAPKPKFVGLESNSKHISTKKAGGTSWDEIRDKVYG